MTQAYDFIQKTRGMTKSDMSFFALCWKAEQFPNQLAPEGTSKIAVFPDHSSVIINDWDTDSPRVVARST